MPRSVVDTTRPRGSTRRGLRPLALSVRALLLMGSLALLAACGGPTGGGTPPPKIEYVFSATAQVPIGDFDEHSLVWIAEARGFGTSGQVYTDWFSSYPIAADGTVQMEIDARDVIADLEPFDPREVLDWLLFGTTVEYTVSDPAARWKVLNNGRVYQLDVEAGTADLGSHHVMAATTIGYVTHTTYPVFSDRAVTITASLDEPTDGVRYAVDVDLQAGWNLMYGRFEANTYTVHSRLVEGPQELWVRMATAELARGTDEVARGFAVFSQHELIAGEHNRLYAASFGSSSVRVFAPAWLASGTDNPSLVPMPDAYPGVFSSAGLTVDPPEARGAVAAAFAYDSEATPVSGWSEDPTAALGELSFLSSADVPVWHIYSDRTATLTLDVPYGAGARLTTPTAGLTLQHGWNMVEVRPGGPDEFQLVRTYEVPASWAILPR